MTESPAARLAEVIAEMRRFGVDSPQTMAWVHALAAIQAEPAEPETVLPSMHGFAAAPIERGETLNPYPDVADRLQQAAWCGNSVYHDDYTPGIYDVRCKACLRAFEAIRTLVADLVPRRAVSVDDALSSPMAAGLVLQVKAECEAQHARAEAAEQQIAALTRKNETLRNAWETSEQDRISTVVQIATLTAQRDAALELSGYAALMAERDRWRQSFEEADAIADRQLLRAEAAETDRESIAEMLHDQEAANIVLMALVETWTARAHAAEAERDELQSRVTFYEQHTDKQANELVARALSIADLTAERDKWLANFNRGEQFQDGPTKRADAAEARVTALQVALKQAVKDCLICGGSGIVKRLVVDSAMTVNGCIGFMEISSGTVSSHLEPSVCHGCKSLRALLAAPSAHEWDCPCVQRSDAVCTCDVTPDPHTPAGVVSLAQVVEALGPWLNHYSTCASAQIAGVMCDCGLAKALQAQSDGVTR